MLGRKVSGFSIREKLGGGNTNRFKKVWDGYLSSQTGENAEPAAELPLEIAEAVRVEAKNVNEWVLGLAIKLNDKAIKAAEHRMKEDISSANYQRDQAERELADAQAVIQSQTMELTKLQERLALAEQYAAELEKLRNELIEQKQKAVTREEATIETGQLKTTEPTQVSNGQQTRNLSLGLDYHEGRNPYDFSSKRS
jgi:uncharacterized protein (DUF3084 family)